MEKQLKILIIRTEIDQQCNVLDIDYVWSSPGAPEVDMSNCYATSCPSCAESIRMNVFVNSNLSEIKEELEDEVEVWEIEKNDMDCMVQEECLESSEYETIKEVPETFDDIIEEYREDDEIEVQVLKEKSVKEILKGKMTDIVEDEELLFECEICKMVTFFFNFL